MTQRKLHIDIQLGGQLTPAEHRDLWRIRTTYLTLTKSEEDDFAYFTDFITKPNGLVIRFLDPAGVPQGFFTALARPFTHNGRSGLVLFTKYFYMHRAYRGHPKSMIAPWFVLWRTIRQFGRQPLYYAGTTFPQSYVSIARTAGNVHTLADSDITAWEHAAILDLMPYLYPSEWDTEQQVIKNQNVPDGSRSGKSTASKALYAKYGRINPTWAEGHSIPIIFAVNGQMARHAIWQTIKRFIG